MSASSLVSASPTVIQPPSGRTSGPPRIGFFEQAWPGRLILGAFLVVTLPVAVGVLTGLDRSWLGWVYVWAFGATHLVLTVTIYCTSSNLRHFTAGWRNRLLFFGAPLGVVAVFGLVHGLDVATHFPVLVGLLYAGVRLFNFLHLTRQTFGVYQLFKARTKERFPAWVKRAENGSGLTLVGALFVTHLSGGGCPLLIGGGPLSVAELTPLYSPQIDLALAQFEWTAFAATALGLYAAAMWAVPRTDRGLTAVTYLTVQTVSTCAAAVFLPLYLAALAIHYVESHVLMWPRVFRLPLDPASRLDRTYGWVRDRPVVFYGLLLLVAAAVTGGMDAMSSAATDSWVGLMVLFDACVLGHYILEMLIWRFSDPHYRKTLGELYIAAKS